MLNLWNREYYSPHFESTLKISSDSLNFIEGLENYVKITDQGQTGLSSLRSLALRIEILVKTAYPLYTEDYRNSVMKQTFIRCLDNELKTAALKNTQTINKRQENQK